MVDLAFFGCWFKLLPSGSAQYPSASSTENKRKKSRKQKPTPQKPTPALQFNFQMNSGGAYTRVKPNSRTTGDPENGIFVGRPWFGNVLGKTRGGFAKPALGCPF
jgi:hypothetical protein